LLVFLTYVYQNVGFGECKLSLYIIYHCTTFHRPGFSISLVITIKPGAQENTHSATVLLFYIVKRNIIVTNA